MLPILSCSFFLKFRRSVGLQRRQDQSCSSKQTFLGMGPPTDCYKSLWLSPVKLSRDSWPQQMLRGECWQETVNPVSGQAKSQKRTRWQRPQKRLKKQENRENSKGYISYRVGPVTTIGTQGRWVTSGAAGDHFWDRTALWHRDELMEGSVSRGWLSRALGLSGPAQNMWLASDINSKLEFS